MNIINEFRTPKLVGLHILHKKICQKITFSIFDHPQGGPRPLATIKKMQMGQEGDVKWFWVLLGPYYLKTPKTACPLIFIGYLTLPPDYIMKTN